VIEEFAVDEAVASTDLLEKAAFVAVGEELGKVPGDAVVESEDDAEREMLDDGITSKRKRYCQHTK
jgi:hypothetical protein